MKRVMCITICILLLLGCSKEKQQAGDGEKLEWQRLKAVQIYWQKARNSELESFSTTLRSMSEPVYWNNPTNQQDCHFYRFLWLRTFDKPMVITVNSLGDGRCEVRSKVFSGPCGSTLGQIEQQKSVTNDSQDIAALIADLDRWLPYVPEFDGNFGADGAVWMIDGVNQGKYFLIHRWNPKSGWVHEMGLRFLKAADNEAKKGPPI